MFKRNYIKQNKLFDNRRIILIFYNTVNLYCINYSCIVVRIYSFKFLTKNIFDTWTMNMNKNRYVSFKFLCEKEKSYHSHRLVTVWADVV